MRSAARRAALPVAPPRRPSSAFIAAASPRRCCSGAAHTLPPPSSLSTARECIGPFPSKADALSAVDDAFAKAKADAAKAAGLSAQTVVYFSDEESDGEDGGGGDDDDPNTVRPANSHLNERLVYRGYLVHVFRAPKEDVDGEDGEDGGGDTIWYVHYRTMDTIDRPLAGPYTSHVACFTAASKALLDRRGECSCVAWYRRPRCSVAFVIVASAPPRPRPSGGGSSLTTTTTTPPGLYVRLIRAHLDGVLAEPTVAAFQGIAVVYHEHLERGVFDSDQLVGLLHALLGAVEVQRPAEQRDLVSKTAGPAPLVLDVGTGPIRVARSAPPSAYGGGDFAAATADTESARLKAIAALIVSCGRRVDGDTQVDDSSRRAPPTLGQVALSDLGPSHPHRRPPPPADSHGRPALRLICDRLLADTAARDAGDPARRAVLDAVAARTFKFDAKALGAWRTTQAACLGQRRLAEREIAEWQRTRSEATETRRASSAPPGDVWIFQNRKLKYAPMTPESHPGVFDPNWGQHRKRPPEKRERRVPPRVGRWSVTRAGVTAAQVLAHGGRSYS